MGMQTTIKSSVTVHLHTVARSAIFFFLIFLPFAAHAERPVEIRFANSTVFDQQLSSAMAAEARVIKVSIVPASDNRIPPRLKAWLERLMKERGEVRWRDDGGRGAVAVLLGVVLSFLAEKAIEFVVDRLSDPVRHYHAVISFKMSGKTTQVSAIEFYRRDSSAWIEAVATSNATK